MPQLTIAIFNDHMVKRLQALTDAILAIIATLMILSIPMPIALDHNRYSWSITTSALTIFLVSFLVVMSFYFTATRFFDRVSKISGLQVFAYTMFLLVVSLFPFMTQLEFGDFAPYFGIIYTLYIVFLSRLQGWIQSRIYKLNKVQHVRKPVHPIDIFLLIVCVFLTILLGYLKFPQYSSAPLIYLPLRSLFRTTVFE